MFEDEEDLDWTQEEGSIVREESAEPAIPYDLGERTARFGEAIIDFRALNLIFSAIWRKGNKEQA